MLCYKSPLVSQPQPFLGHTGISNQRVLNAVGLIQRSIPVNVWFQLLLRTSSWKHKVNHTLDCFIGSRARHKDLETGHVCAVVTNICTWRWDWLPSLGSLGQVRYQSWEEKGWFIMWKKGQKFACLLKPAKSGFNLWKHTKTPSWRKRYVVFSWPPFSLVASFSFKIISTALFMGLYRRLCMG